jgi:hypothetical protein
MKKILLLLIFFSLTSICIFSQKDSKLSNEEKEILGVWEAASENKSYEITFVKGSVYSKDLKTTMEVVFGSVKYLERGKIIKSADIKDFGSVPIIVHYGNGNREFNIHYTEFENEKIISGRARFDINTDGKTAHWHSLYQVTIWEPHVPKETFDIPKELTFTKKPSTKSGSSDQVIPHFEFP